MLGKPPAQRTAANQAASLFAHFYFYLHALEDKKGNHLHWKVAWSFSDIYLFLHLRPVIPFIHHLTIFFKTYVWFLIICSLATILFFFKTFQFKKGPTYFFSFKNRCFSFPFPLFSFTFWFVLLYDKWEVSFFYMIDFRITGFIRGKSDSYLNILWSSLELAASCLPLHF